MGNIFHHNKKMSMVHIEHCRDEQILIYFWRCNHRLNLFLVFLNFLIWIPKKEPIFKSNFPFLPKQLNEGFHLQILHLQFFERIFNRMIGNFFQMILISGKIWNGKRMNIFPKSNSCLRFYSILLFLNLQIVKFSWPST